MVEGIMTNLPIGNTKVIARLIQEKTWADMFEIEPLKPYPEDYTKTTEIAQAELAENARPDIKKLDLGLGQYDLIFLGYPNWWSTMPMPVFSFLESYDFANKIIIPFCTHEGSKLGISEKHIKELCPQSKILFAKDFLGITVNSDEIETEINNWLDEIQNSLN